MGEMTISGLDDALLSALRDKADALGLAPEILAAELLRKGLDRPLLDRARVARSIQVAQIRPSPLNSVDLIREDRDRG